MHTHLWLLDLLHGYKASWSVAGESLLTVTDELETWIKRNHLLTVPGKDIHTINQSPRGKYREAIWRLHGLILSQLPLLPTILRPPRQHLSVCAYLGLFSPHRLKHKRFKRCGGTTARAANLALCVQRWGWKKWLWPDRSAAASVITSQSRLGPINSRWCMCLHICVSSTFSF